MTSYSYQDLLAAYRHVGVAPGETVYVTSDMLRVSDYEERGAEALMAAHFNALWEILGPDGTMVASTRSMLLCNTDRPFDPAVTPCWGVGAFSEWVRRRPELERSFHPFCSYGAIGRHAKTIVENASRHAYGPESPEARMLDLNALHVAVGVEPEISCSTIHHCEHVMAVPYRYAKEFLHPVVRGGETVIEPFYMYVWYRDIGVVCDRNRRLFSKIGDSLGLRQAPLGRGFVKSYRNADFYRLTCKVMATDDIFIWCENEPEIRPYRN